MQFIQMKLFYLFFGYIFFQLACLLVHGYQETQRYMVPKIFTILSLIITYFTGPVGLVIYWLIRIFFSKKISFND